MKIGSDWKASSTSPIFLLDPRCNNYHTFAVATWLAFLPHWNCLQIRCTKNRQTKFVTWQSRTGVGTECPECPLSRTNRRTKFVTWHSTNIRRSIAKFQFFSSRCAPGKSEKSKWLLLAKPWQKMYDIMNYILILNSPIKQYSRCSTK